MDSTGLRTVLLAKELTDTLGCELSIVPGPPSVQRIFEITALLDGLPWTDAATAIAVEKRCATTEVES
jgi:anti-anti-sigma regulatory factor